MHQEQAALNRQQLEVLCAQAQTQTQIWLLQSLLTQVGAGAPSPPLSTLSGVRLQKLTVEDNPQSFLNMFESTAEACGWPAAEWNVQLLPLLLGEAQTAAHGLPATAQQGFQAVRKAILDQLGFSPEDHSHRFRTIRLGAAGRPFTFTQQLRDTATRWLQPGEAASKGQMLEKIMLVQFIEGLPTGTSESVRCHRPPDLAAVVTLVEDHLTVHDKSQPLEGQPAAPDHPTPAVCWKVVPLPMAPGPRPTFTRPSSTPHSNPPYASAPSQVPAAAATALDPQGVPQAPGQECWRCGWPGHFRRECPLMEVSQVVRVAGPPTPSPGTGGTVFW